MRNLLLLVNLFLLSYLPMTAQEYFPSKCEGNWEGKMVMYLEGSAMDTIDISMKIERIPDTTGWTWQTIYNTLERTISKHYSLYLVEGTSNEFLLDENNGIQLLNFAADNRMFSNFEVQGNLLTSVYRLDGERLIFEITSGKPDGQTKNDISHYSITTIQISELYKKL